MSHLPTFPSPGRWGDVWAVNTNRGGLGTPTAEVGKTHVWLTFGDGSVRTVTPEDYAEIQAGREWFEAHPQQEAADGSMG